jgi:hypothetical protein
MATITFSYSADFNDNEHIASASLLTPSLEYRIDVDKAVEVSIDDMYQHFNQWLRGLGYNPK